MFVWTVSEAYCQHDDENEVSSYCEVAKSEEEAKEVLRGQILERMDENVICPDDYADGGRDEDGKTREERLEELFREVMDSHDGFGWYRYVGANETFAWNVGKREI